MTKMLIFVVVLKINKDWVYYKELTTDLCTIAYHNFTILNTALFVVCGAKVIWSGQDNPCVAATPAFVLCIIAILGLISSPAFKLTIPCNDVAEPN